MVQVMCTAVFPLAPCAESTHSARLPYAPERRQSMRKAARKTAQDRFCSTRILPRYIAYYESLQNGNPLPRRGLSS